ncbi:MAG: matrixin family metalloprotease [Nanoarchaeota archaeon]
MKVLDLIILLLFFVVIGLGAFLVFLVTAPDTTVYEGYESRAPEYIQGSDFSEKSFSPVQQFYPNIRFPDSELTYVLDPACDRKKEENILGAFSLLSSRTILRFSPALEGKTPSIRVLCSEVAPAPDQSRHFVAGEGGPNELINISSFYIILQSKISLYRSDRCSQPKIALHELLHALGFNHTSDPESIMYPVSSCSQQLDESIIDEINRLYRIPSAPDLVLDAVSVSRIGNTLSFAANVSNRGFVSVLSANLSVYSGGTFLKSFSLTENGLPIGAMRLLHVKNMQVPKDAILFSFVVEQYIPSREIHNDNNRLEVALDKYE